MPRVMQHSQRSGSSMPRRPELEEERELRRGPPAATPSRRNWRCVTHWSAPKAGARPAVRWRRRWRGSSATRATRVAARDARGLADGDAPIHDLGLQDTMARRLGRGGGRASARRQVEMPSASCVRWTSDLAAELRVNEARDAMEQARLAAQESRLRREALLEQFAATHCELDVIRANLAADAEPAPWETRIAEVRTDIERLGQVNLAAIDELKEQSERKSYLDRQYTDVGDALNTLKRRCKDRQRDARASKTPSTRINQGLNEKFRGCSAAAMPTSSWSAMTR
jgi:chromosome segregation protein